MELIVKVTAGTKDILDIYDAEKLLTTIPNSYSINPNILKVYSNKAKSLNTTTINILQDTYDRINAMASNHNVPFSLMFSFLVENVCDCGKINNKKITHALDDYYDLVVNSVKDNASRELFTKLLDSYSSSAFYDEEIGLSEESIAHFLTISKER